MNFNPATGAGNHVTGFHQDYNGNLALSRCAGLALSADVAHPEHHVQNENSICRSIRRLAEPEENGGPASAFDVPNSGESRLPTGGA